MRPTLPRCPTPPLPGPGLPRTGLDDQPDAHGDLYPEGREGERQTEREGTSGHMGGGVMDTHYSSWNGFPGLEMVSVMIWSFFFNQLCISINGLAGASLNVNL